MRAGVGAADEGGGGGGVCVDDKIRNRDGSGKVYFFTVSFKTGHNADPSH